MRRAIVLAVVLILGGTILLVPWPAPAPRAAGQEVVIHARQYAYAPGVVRVSRGERITLVLEADDLTHGLYVDGYGVDLVAVPGRPARASFVAAQSGKFRVRCSKICGNLHPFMLGELIVEPNNSFGRSVSLAILAAVGTVAFLGVGRRRADGGASA